MHGVDQLSFAVVLRAFELDAELLRHLAKPTFHVREAGVAIAFRLTNAEQVEIGTVEDGDPHRCFSPCNQELNCSMSSSLRSAGSPAAGISCDVRPPPDVLSPSTLCEKNWSNEKPCDVRGVREPSRNTLSSVSSPLAGRVGLPVSGVASLPEPNACASAEAAESSEWREARLPNSASIDPPGRSG